MSSHNSLRRALSAAILFFCFFATTLAQQCYYPDGTESSDEPCSTSPDGSPSACCGSNAFCMDNGLCYESGIVSRGSCTDKSWDSEACGTYCTDVDQSSSVAITPCDSKTFACGLNSTACSTSDGTFQMSGGAFVLRPAQVEMLVSGAVTTSYTTVTASPAATSSSDNTAEADDSSKQFTAGALAGVACGVALPLLLVLAGALLALRRERQKHAPPKLMYKLPDDHDDFETGFKSQHSLGRAHSMAPSMMSHGAPPSTIHSFVGLDRCGTSASDRPFTVGSFMERYDSMKKGGSPRDRIELDAAPPYKKVERIELSTHRMSGPLSPAKAVTRS